MRAIFQESQEEGIEWTHLIEDFVVKDAFESMLYI